MYSFSLRIHGRLVQTVLDTLYEEVLDFKNDEIFDVTDDTFSVRFLRNGDSYEEAVRSTISKFSNIDGVFVKRLVEPFVWMQSLNEELSLREMIRKDQDQKDKEIAWRGK